VNAGITRTGNPQTIQGPVLDAVSIQPPRAMTLAWAILMACSVPAAGMELSLAIAGRKVRARLLMPDPITFIASFPQTQGAIKFDGNGGCRIQLDSPDSETWQLARCIALRGKLLRVTIEEVQDEWEQRQREGKGKS